MMIDFFFFLVMASRYSLFKKFENKEYISLTDLPKMICDLYAAANKEILPKTNIIVSLDLRIPIPKGFFGKIFSRSGLFLNYKITAAAGVFDSGFRGIVQVLLFNHSDKTFYAKKGDRIAKLFFWKYLM